MRAATVLGLVPLATLALVPLLPSSSATAAESATAPSGPTTEATPAPAKADQIYDVMESRFCADCHPAIYAEHEQSTHGRAFTDAEVRLATARFDLKDCIICHTPRPIFETGVGQNPTRRHYGLEEGNTCMSCHWQPDYDYDAFTGGTECRDAFHPDVGTVQACASCHRNHGTPFQWEKAPTGRESGNTCMDCHMETVTRPVAVGGPVREVRTHLFPGGRSEKQLRRAYAYRAAVDGNQVKVTVRNKGAGHNFPTELKQRSVESLVVVRDLAGNEIARSRMVFRDPYKRPYGLRLPVSTQIPGGESREHVVPIGVEAGTIETTLFYKLYYPIDDFHPELSRVLESRTIPFADVEPSDAPVESAPDVKPVTPEGILPELSSVGNMVDFARPPIGTVEVNIPTGDTPDDIQKLVELFQFPVPQANRDAQKALEKLGVTAMPALIEALGSWDNKTYKQSMHVIERIGKPARPYLLEAMEGEQLYTRLHSREIVARLYWRDDEVAAILDRAVDSTNALDRASVANKIGRLRLRQLAPRLVSYLEDRDPDVVREAALALSELGHADATEALVAAHDRAYYDETKRDLAFALAQLGSPAGMLTLLAGLDHEDDLIRERFFELFFTATGKHAGYDPLAPRPDRLEAIAELQNWWAEDGGAEALLGPDPDYDPVAEAYARSLVSKLGGTDLGPTGNDADRQLEEELVGMGRYAVPALVRGLKYPAGFAGKRALICETLGRIGDKRAAPALSATLRDPVVSVSAWAAWALEVLADPATRPALSRYEQRIRTLIATNAVPESAGHGDALLAQAARTRLVAGDRDARATLISLLLSENLTARQLSIGALAARSGDTRGFDPAGPEAERREAALRWMSGR